MLIILSDTGYNIKSSLTGLKFHKITFTQYNTGQILVHANYKGNSFQC